jgi:DNA sulfur modification protein DndB
MMPTYQRLIKKDRLRSIRNYVENENGFFPNSIIVSVDYKDKPVCFEEFANGKSEIATSGLLYLPKQYRSIFIIDGQHR